MTTTSELLAAQSSQSISIGANSAVRVYTGLQFRDGDPATPHFVKINSTCPYLNVYNQGTNATGSFFDIHNPTTEQVSFSWKAHHLHSEEREPLPTYASTTEAIEAPAPICSAPGGGGGGFWVGENIVAFVSPNYPGAVDDNDLSTPFLTIQGATNAIDNLGKGQRAIVYVAAGQYNEDLNIPSAQAINYVAMGRCSIGVFGTAPNTVTTPRDVVFVADGTQEPADFRPSIAFTSYGDDISEQQAISNGWNFSRDIIGAAGVDPNTTIELILDHARIYGTLRQDLVTPHTGGLSSYFHRVLIQNANEGEAAINYSSFRAIRLSKSAILGNINGAWYTSITECLLFGNISWTTGFLDTDPIINGLHPTGGFIDCVFQTGASISLPAGPNGILALDAYSDYRARIAGITVVGGGQKTLLKEDATGEMYQNGNAVATAIAAINTWTDITNMISGAITGFTFIDPSLTVERAGLYEVQYHITAINEQADAANVYEFSIDVGGVIQANVTQRESIDPNSIPKSISGGGIISLNAGDNITLQVQNITDADNITIIQANVTIRSL